MENQRRIPLQIRINEEDKKMIRYLAEKEGTSASDMIRLMIRRKYERAMRGNIA